MNTRGITIFRLACVLFLLGCLAAGKEASSGLSIERTEEKITVLVDGELYTAFHLKGITKPYCWPVIGPTGVGMTRDFPMKKGTPNESTDHPHHQAIYFVHGVVNGIDFWNSKGTNPGDPKIEVTEVVRAEVREGGVAVVETKSDWTDNGKKICSDTTEVLFSVDGKNRYIDYKVTIHASEGKVTLGDTKEGTMAVRMNRFLHLESQVTAKGKGKGRGPDARGRVVNSEGIEGKGVWGKRAKWVDYRAEIEGEVAGVTMFDHPDNLRHPTTWHARDYGLVAANPFGIHYFEKKQKGAGDYEIANGESLALHYRIVFHSGDPKPAELDAQWKKWAEN